MTGKQAAFARIWRGRVRRDRAEEYQAYWLAQGVDPLLGKGALGVQSLREDRGDETEFMTISYWESLEAMTGGSGADPREAHHLERDPEFLIELPREVQVLQLLRTDGVTGDAP